VTNEAFDQIKVDSRLKDTDRRLEAVCREIAAGRRKLLAQMGGQTEMHHP
jgi:hypothetical protein